MCRMANFRWWPQTVDRPCQKNRADLFGPKIVLRHVGEATKAADMTPDGNFPAGFFAHFAVQGGNRMFPGIDSAAGQLIFWLWRILVRQQDQSATRQDGVNSRSARILLALSCRLAVTSDHVATLGPEVAVPL